GNSSAPVLNISYRRCTPVVVSSVTPLISWPMAVHRLPSDSSDAASSARTTLNSSLSVESTDGTEPAFSNSVPLCTSMVASPPSSRIMFGPENPEAAGHSRARRVHSQYSSSVSPFQAYTGVPRGSSIVPSPTTTAAAAWSWVEKMLQLTQRTSAPSA